MRTRFEDNAYPEIAAAAKANAIVIVPLGCTEQHGPHLPVGCDLGRPLEAAELAQQKRGAKVLVLPTLPFGPAGEHLGFPGTISLSFNTWSAVVVEVLNSLLRDGFRRIVVAKGCGGHMGIEGPVYEFYCKNKRSLPDLDIRVWGDQVGRQIGKLAAESGLGHPNEVHAGGIETSMALAANPDLVHLDRLAPPAKQRRHWSGNWWIMEELSETGATGDPTRYDAEFGRKLCAKMNELFCDFLGEMWRWQAR